ncbi:MAG: nucleotidyltransferase family protein [Candidatus Latescibacteria bacterium]|jgi:hypothetical protein|nr:nucleotidyltransferase family protein [Candidatus Latescibacterota bacterium]
MTSCVDILKLLEQHRGKFRQLGVRRLGLFGSAVRDQATDDSDLDFVVDFDQKSFDAYMDLKFFLEDTFGRSVDLVISDTIKPRLKDTILKESIYVQGL